MSARRQLGAILLESGRITEADVERVLEHQRIHGGYFGQALVALDIVSREEIDWALASQFDLPFIFPNADAVDRDAARLVSPDWALAHLAVPIVHAGKTLTVVVADPLRGAVLDELRARTGLEIEMALASAGRIRELIHAIYGETADEIVDEIGAQAPVTLSALFADALERGAERFGISLRGTAATGWHFSDDQLNRQPLAEGWEILLEEAVQPAPLAQVQGVTAGLVQWRGSLNRGGVELPLAAQALVGAGGIELLFVPDAAQAPSTPRTLVMSPTITTELRLLARGGHARVAVVSAPAAIAQSVLPELPRLVLGEHARAAHITTHDETPPVFTLHTRPEDELHETLGHYGFDALTLDLPIDAFPVARIVSAAPLSFVLLDANTERERMRALGINWVLTVKQEKRGPHQWDLRALDR